MTVLKRSLASLAIAGVLALPLAGCASTATTNSTTTSTSTASATASSTSTAASSSIDGISSGEVTVTFGDKQVTLKAAYLIDGKNVTVDSGTYASVTSDQAVFLVVNGGSLTISNATVNKSGDASTNSEQNAGDVSDDYNFYGLNSAIVVIGEGSKATVSGTTITANASGSNAVFSSLSASVEVSDTTITTDGNSSRGLHATYAGTITGADLTITTSGAHSAALATDRGSGTVTVTGTNVLNTSGDGSPLIYSTGTISASGVTGTAKGSSVVVVEGKNHATLTDSKVTSTGAGDAVMLYQSFSGDAADADAQTSASTLVLKNTTITYTGTGPLLYFTNTSAKVTLTNSGFVSSTASGLASAAEDRWGTRGSNGATATVTVSKSALSGKVNADDSSSLTISLTNGSTLKGAASGNATVTTDSTSSHTS